MHKRILGLDPSLNRLGWCIIDYNDETEIYDLIDYGYIDAKKFKESEEDMKLQMIYRQISSILSKYRPHVVISESPFYSRNVATLNKLSHVHGVLLLISLEHGNRMKYYSPLTIKSIVLGGIKTKDESGKKKSGDDLKKEVEEEVYKIFPKKLFTKPYTNDVTDAISVAITYVKKNGEGTLGENKEEKKEKKKKTKTDKKKK